MKMPDTIPEEMFAPCGMNCMACYRHCVSKKACGGCADETSQKNEHCRKCTIKDCVREKGIQFCFSCKNYPCKTIKTLEKRNLNRYGHSLIENSLQVKERGLTAFLESERDKWTCGKCDGIISLHDNECSECHTFFGKNRLLT